MQLADKAVRGAGRRDLAQDCAVEASQIQLREDGIPILAKASSRAALRPLFPRSGAVSPASLSRRRRRPGHGRGSASAIISDDR